MNVKQELGPKRRTIIFVWNYLEWGGAQIYFLAIIKIARAEWDILVLLPEESSPEIVKFLRQAGARCEFLKYSTMTAAPGFFAKLQRQYARLRSEAEIFRRLQAFRLSENIVHIEIAPWQSWQLLTLFALRRANVFMTMHNFMPSASALREAVWRLRLEFISRLPGVHIVASNHDTKNRLTGWVKKEFYRRITVAHTAVNPDQIAAARLDDEQAAELRRRQGIPTDKTVVLAVGQFIDRKGRWIFLEAAAKVKQSGEDILFVWLSPKSPTEAESDAIEAFDLGDRFKLILSSALGSEREDVLRFFGIADIFALPSFIEGLPIALLEAMALGVPSISTNVFAIPEAIKSGDTGILIEPGKSDELAHAILRLKRDASLRRRLSAAGRTFVLREFDERDAAAKCIAAYSRCFSDER